MIKKTITYENFAEEQVTETFLFNMSKGELTILQLAAIDQRTESLQDKLEKIGKSLQGQELADVLDELIMKTIGEKTTDGKGFVKNDQIRDNFKISGAWSELVHELCSDAEAMAEFVNGLMPKNLRNEVANNDAVKTRTAQQVREDALAAKGGHNKPQAPKSVQTVPELHTIIEQTAEPVLVGEPEGTAEDLAAEFEAWKASQKQPSTQQ